MISPMVYGKVEGGKLIADDPAILQAAFRCHEGKRIEFQVKRFQKVRTESENKYYWGVVVFMVAEAMGYDPKMREDKDTVHGILKWECNFEMRVVGRGTDRKEIHAPLSTANISTLDFEAYLERCRRWASMELNIYIPLPNEVMPS